MFSPVRLSISDLLPSYLANGDASFIDYHDLPEEYLTAIDERVTALGIECWGDIDDYPAEGGVCDITGERGSVLRATGFIRKTGRSAIKDATREHVQHMISTLMAAHPESGHLTSTPAGYDVLTVPGVKFYFYPEDIHCSRYDVRTLRVLD